MVRLAQDADWEAVHGARAPAQWFGLVSERGPLIEGLGGVYADVEGRWWITFVRCPGVGKIKTAHAAAKQLLAMAAERDVDVHALADPKISGSEAWIERLGFVRAGEEREGHPVWVRKS